MMLSRCPFQSQYAMEVLIEILRLISSGSKSVVVLPSSTLPSRVTAPAANSKASTREVLPTPPWPTTPTLRSFAVSIIHGPPADDLKWRNAITGTDAASGALGLRERHAKRGVGGRRYGSPKSESRAARTRGFGGSGTGPPNRSRAPRERGGLGEAGRVPQVNEAGRVPRTNQSATALERLARRSRRRCRRGRWRQAAAAESS